MPRFNFYRVSNKSVRYPIKVENVKKGVQDLERYKMTS